MSFDEIITMVYTWVEVNGRFIQLTSQNIGDLVGDNKFLTGLLPDAVKNASIFGIMFATGFGLFLGITIWKWAKETIL